MKYFEEKKLARKIIYLNFGVGFQKVIDELHLSMFYLVGRADHMML